MKEEKVSKGLLWVVSVPIGNPDDITIRASEALKACDFVICEEIKEASKILRRLNLTKTMETLNEHSDDRTLIDLVQKLKSGSRAALISDCGTPLLADPGSNLVKNCLTQGIDVKVLPGASALLTALPRCGFDMSSFVFAGFVAREPFARLADLERLSNEKRTVVLYETPYRLAQFLDAAAKVMPEREAYIGCNLTTAQETHHYGSFEFLKSKFEDSTFKGEFVICFQGADKAKPFFQRQGERNNDRTADFRKKEFEKKRRDERGGFDRRDKKPSYSKDDRGSYDKRDKKPSYPKSDRYDDNKSRPAKDFGKDNEKRRIEDRRKGKDERSDFEKRKPNNDRKSGDKPFYDKYKKRK